MEGIEVTPIHTDFRRLEEKVDKLTDAVMRLVLLEELLEHFVSGFVIARDLDAAPEDVVGRDVDQPADDGILDVVEPRNQDDLLNAPA